MKDCQIYCRRVQELHGSPDDFRDELFVFSLERFHIWAMFDPNMLGRDKLVDHIQDMDDIRSDLCSVGVAVKHKKGCVGVSC